MSAYYPVLDPRVIARATRPLPGALAAPGAIRLRYARTGLRLIAAALAPATTVVVPDFLCRSAVEPFDDAGLAVRRYRIGQDLRADPEEVERAAGGRRFALLVVSYFGLPQPFDELRELCLRRDAMLIDDAAHSLLSEHGGRPYGTLGDAGVTTVHKTLPVPDGAVAVGSERLVLSAAASLPRHGRAPAMYALRTLLRNVDAALALDVLGRRARRLSGGLPPDDAAGPHEALGWSLLTRLVAPRVDAGAERALRRRVFERWPALLEGSGATPLAAAALAAGVCPSGFPARIDDERRFARAMEALRVEWIRWPDRPSDSAALPRGVAVLPTHTALGDRG